MIGAQSNYFSLQHLRSVMHCISVRSANKHSPPRIILFVLLFCGQACASGEWPSSLILLSIHSTPIIVEEYELLMLNKHISRDKDFFRSRVFFHSYYERGSNLRQPQPNEFIHIVPS